MKLQLYYLIKIMITYKSTSDTIIQICFVKICRTFLTCTVHNKELHVIMDIVRQQERSNKGTKSPECCVRLQSPKGKWIGGCQNKVKASTSCPVIRSGSFPWSIMRS